MHVCIQYACMNVYIHVCTVCMYAYIHSYAYMLCKPREGTLKGMHTYDTVCIHFTFKIYF